MAACLTTYQDLPLPVSGRWLVTVTPVLQPHGSVASFLKAFIAHALATDDVFKTEFLEGILIITELSNVEIDPETSELLKTWGNSWVHFVPPLGAPAPSPCVLDGGKLSPVWRVFDDTAGAFSLPLRRDNTDTQGYSYPKTPILTHNNR